MLLFYLLLYVHMRLGRFEIASGPFVRGAYPGPPTRNQGSENEYRNAYFLIARCYIYAAVWSFTLIVVFHVLTTFILMENILASRYWLNRGVSWNIDLGNDLTFNKCKYNIRFERQWCNILHAHSFAIDFIYERSRKYSIWLFHLIQFNDRK